MRCRAKTIIVYFNDDTMFQISQEWIEEELDCHLKVDGKILTSWQISQKAIGKLLFP